MHLLLRLLLSDGQQKVLVKLTSKILVLVGTTGLRQRSSVHTLDCPSVYTCVYLQCVEDSHDKSSQRESSYDSAPP